MGWARFDDGWHEHPKTVAAGLEGAGLFAMCVTWANKTRKKSPRPGFVPREMVVRFAGPKAARLAKRLVDLGSFEPVDGGWMIHDFTHYLPKYDSQKAAEAGRKGAASRWGEHPDEPPPDDEPPYEPDDGLPSDRHPNAWRTNGTRAGAPASARRNPVPVPTSSHLGSSVTGVDTRLLPLQDALNEGRLVVRWDKLAPTDVDRVAWLIDVHGVGALVAAAQRAWQPNDPPAYANAWLGAWDVLPLPRPRVVPEFCEVHRQEQPCRGCAADAKAVTA